MLALAVGAVVAQSGNDLFQQALVKERTDGNMAAAIALYQTIVEKHGTDRALVAKALVQMGQCYEKLGKAEARKAYETVLRDYADQADSAAQARTRLAVMAPGVSATNPTAMAVRQIWAGPDVDNTGTPTPDGRFLTFIDWSTGDVAVRNLATGEKRRLTHKDPRPSPQYEHGGSPIVSPDGSQVAYSWSNKDDFYDLRVVPFWHP